MGSLGLLGRIRRMQYTFRFLFSVSCSPFAHACLFLQE